MGVSSVCVCVCVGGGGVVAFSTILSTVEVNLALVKDGWSAH